MSVRFHSILFVVCIFQFTILAAQEFDVTSTNVTFDNGRFTLHGELIIPDTVQNAPVLIFLPGSGGNASYRTIYKSFVEENLEKLFLEEGFAILYYDKRGVGRSKGRWPGTTLYEQASDTKAAIDFLKEQGRIDPTRIGVVGHSEGGWVAQIVGDRYREDIKVVASLASPTFDIRLKLTNENYSDNLCAGIPDNEAFDRAGKKAISDINWVSWFPVGKKLRELRNMRFFDPAPHLLELEMPTFFAFAENDADVYPGWAIGVLNETFNNSVPDYFSLQIIPNANQHLKMVDMCASREEIDAAPYSEFFQKVFKNWILNNI
jgi:pimeloyl-ACP methyl ester carboxylesterase